MAPSPSPDPRLPTLVAIVLLTALLAAGWPHAAAALPATVRVTGPHAGRVNRTAAAARQVVVVDVVAPPRPGVTEGGPTTAAERPDATGAAAATPAGWRAPLDGPLTVARPFEPPATPYGPGHRGVDLAAPAGTIVRAAAGGVVSFAGMLAGRGVVAVTHGALRTTYEPLTVLVRVGQPVAAGTPLGLLAAGHAACRPAACLHWGLIRGQVYLSPLALLLPAPPRLLPLGSAS